MTDTITLALHAVEIDRGKTRVTVEVPEHEIRVLRAVHGVAEVQDMGESDDEREFNPNAGAEWDRLVRTYKRPNMPDAVQVAYPMGVAALKDAGFTADGTRTAEVPQAGVRNHKKPAAKAAKK